MLLTIKHPILYLTCIALLLGSCKKEKDTANDTITDPNAPAYKITAPSCLIETDSSAGFRGRNYYDSQKRLVKRCERQVYNSGDSIVYTYSYTNNTITEVTKTIPQSGSETVKTYIHYLNNMGLIDSTVGPFFQNYTSKHYVYDNQGYLVRSLYYSGATLSSGNSFLYTGGNQTAVYQLRFDSETGVLYDSSLNNGFTYYSELPGKLDASWAWNNRTGRANANARRDVLNGSPAPAITYSYITENDLPKTRLATYGGNSYYTWTCR
jgi:hypothetical protein